MEKHILLESTAWTIMNPTYTSTISQLTIEEIASSINFNLHHFMYNCGRKSYL